MIIPIEFRGERMKLVALDRQEYFITRIDQTEFPGFGRFVILAKNEDVISIIFRGIVTPGVYQRIIFGF